MATKKQSAAAKKNITKTQSPRRKKPGTTGNGKFYRIEIRPKGDFKTFRIQDVGKKGGLERLAGKRPSGSWDTVTWLVSKEDAKVMGGRLSITDAKARSVLAQIRGPIVHVKGDIFHAHPKKKSSKAPVTKKAHQSNKKKI